MSARLARIPLVLVPPAAMGLVACGTLLVRGRTQLGLTLLGCGLALIVTALFVDYDASSKPVARKRPQLERERVGGLSIQALDLLERLLAAKSEQDVCCPRLLEFLGVELQALLDSVAELRAVGLVYCGQRQDGSALTTYVVHDHAEARELLDGELRRRYELLARPRNRERPSGLAERGAA